SKRGVAVDHTSDHFSEGDSTSLGFTRDVAKAVHQRHVGLVQQVRGELDGFSDCGFFAVDERVGIVVLGRVIFEMRLAEAAGVFGLDDLVGFRVELDVVADASAEGTGGVLYDVHRIESLVPRLFAGPTGRQHEGSTKLPAAEAPFDPPWLIATGFNLGPRRNIFFRQDPETDRLFAVLVYFWLLHAGVPAAINSTSTSHPLESGMPVPSVCCPIRRHVGGPYGTKIMPRGILPSMHLKVVSPHGDLTRTVLPEGTPISFMSSGCMVMVPTVAW